MSELKTSVNFQSWISVNRLSNNATLSICGDPETDSRVERKTRMSPERMMGRERRCGTNETIIFVNLASTADKKSFF